MPLFQWLSIGDKGGDLACCIQHRPLDQQIYPKLQNIFWKYLNQPWANSAVIAPANADRNRPNHWAVAVLNFEKIELDPPQNNPLDLFYIFECTALTSHLYQTFVFLGGFNH